MALIHSSLGFGFAIFCHTKAARPDGVATETTCLMFGHLLMAVGRWRAVVVLSWRKPLRRPLRLPTDLAVAFLLVALRRAAAAGAMRRLKPGDVGSGILRTLRSTFTSESLITPPDTSYRNHDGKFSAMVVLFFSFFQQQLH